MFATCVRLTLSFILLICVRSSFAETRKQEPTSKQAPPRTDIEISGVRPHLTTYGVYSQNGAHLITGHNECGIGAIVPWAGRLWMVNYAPHMPHGSEHKLYSVGPGPQANLRIHPESVGGTPAGRMIHAESEQLLIGHHLIDKEGNVRTISPKTMPMRVTAIARHLVDPKNLVYYIDMEGAIWEANVHTLEAKRLYEKPVPGWHGKGGYTGQGRLVVSNNGETAAGSYDPLVVGGPARPGSEEAGVLAEWDGETWQIIERRQFTEVTGPNGLAGGGDADDPIWAIGWDKRSLRLKVRDHDQWHTYLLPKASYCNDARHGWYTEWPRIREITDGRWMMDMHGMFFDFPPTFSSTQPTGIRPIGSHLRYVPDFCEWNDQLVLATDETSIQGNHLAGQPQSNLWFGQYEDLKQWGPANGYGGPWLEDSVAAGDVSDPFLIAGFDHRVVHLAIGRKRELQNLGFRTTDQLSITNLSKELAQLPRISIKRGDWHRAASGFTFQIDQPATVYIAVDGRGKPQLPKPWERTNLKLVWGNNHDVIFARKFPAGTVEIPANETEHKPDAFGLPHMAFVATDASHIVADKPASVVAPMRKVVGNESKSAVKFTLQFDRKGTNTWTDLDKVSVNQDGYVAYHLPTGLEAEWLRVKVDQDCIATAFLHQTSIRSQDSNTSEAQSLFAGLADVNDADAVEAVVYPAKRNRNLRVIGADDQFFEFTKAGFEFQHDDPDAALQELLHVEPEFTVDEASVVVSNRGQSLRLPKGNARFNKPFSSGWPRAVREVESERHLANLHGTFYEIPLITNGAPPNWLRIRPVASHRKRITDYCSWNGLLVLTGVRDDAKASTHVYTDEESKIALWFGGIDDLWKLGKPVGQGGPWYQSNVQAGTPSDPYLMTGYNRKTVQLSHQSSQPVSITLQVDIDGTGHWCDYRTFEVPSGETLTHAFPTGYSANWIRAVADQSVKATVQLTYE